MTVATPGSTPRSLPEWVPQNARHYLEHTEKGVPIRRLAKRAGLEASTVLRQIRKIEGLRDDPLVDAALNMLGDDASCCGPTTEYSSRAENSHGARKKAPTFDDQAVGVLQRLFEPGAVLAVAAEMEKAVVVRDDGDGDSVRTAVVDADLAQALALKEWIHCAAPGRLSRYRITAAGRAAYQRLVAGAENAARGFAEASPEFQHAQAISAPEKSRRGALNAETPLATLARRRDKDGAPFLAPELVRAGERLREDFELSQMSSGLAQNWDRFLTAGVTGARGAGDPALGAGEAQTRFQSALTDLGPGLGDIALRCCCFQEGLEATEKRMGWSSRSGKIVLRIALQRLRMHYEKFGDASQMIG